MFMENIIKEYYSIYFCLKKKVTKIMKKSLKLNEKKIN